MGTAKAEASMRSAEVRLDAFGLTDRGRQRERNEDQFLIAELSKSMLVEQSSLSRPDHERLLGRSQGKLLLVADGMGGHRGGELASSLAVDVVTHYVLNVMPWFHRLDEAHADDLREELKGALERAHAAVLAAAERDEDHPRMGTTLTMAYVIWPKLYVVHAGDSRAYLFRDADLERITTDHTVAEQMARGNVMPAEEARKTRWSNVLWNAIGGGSHDVAPEVYAAELRPGDALLLCTDGLTKHVDDEGIAGRLEEAASAEAAARALVDAANDDGGSDNTTVVVARFR